MISRLVEADVFSQALVTVHLDTDLVVAFFLWAVREAPLRRQPLAINFTDRPCHAMVVDVLLVRSELFALHLELLLGINCSSALVESRIAERAILLPDARAHLALGTELELASILVVPLAEQAVECVFVVDRFTVKHSLSDLHEHPEIPHGISRRINSLLENSRTTLTVAELTFTFDPHGSWQHYIRILGRDRRVDLADNDERVKDTALVFGTAAKETRKVAHRLGPVVVRSPQEVDVAIRQLTEDLRRMETRSLDFIKIALGKIPNGLREATMCFVCNNQVGWQAMAEGANLASGTTCRRLTRQREAAVTRLAVMPRKQVYVVKVVIHPCTAIVLVNTHRPERRDLDIGIGEKLIELLDVLDRCTGYLRSIFVGIWLQALSIFFERD